MFSFFTGLSCDLTQSGYDKTVRCRILPVVATKRASGDIRRSGNPVHGRLENNRVIRQQLPCVQELNVVNAVPVCKMSGPAPSAIPSHLRLDKQVMTGPWVAHSNSLVCANDGWAGSRATRIQDNGFRLTTVPFPDVSGSLCLAIGYQLSGFMNIWNRKNESAADILQGFC